jgi:hypothetical protein
VTVNNWRYLNGTKAVGVTVTGGLQLMKLYQALGGDLRAAGLQTQKSGGIDDAHRASDG